MGTETFVFNDGATNFVNYTHDPITFGRGASKLEKFIDFKIFCKNFFRVNFGGVFSYQVINVDFHLNGYMTKPKHSNIMGFLLRVKKTWERRGFLLRITLVEDSIIL